MVTYLCSQGRKSGKGCYVYSGRKGKDKSVNKDAEAIIENYRVPIKGRYVVEYLSRGDMCKPSSGEGGVGHG